MWFLFFWLDCSKFTLVCTLTDERVFLKVVLQTSLIIFSRCIRASLYDSLTFCSFFCLSISPIWTFSLDRMASPATASTPEQSMPAFQALLNAPARTPPPGVTPDFNHPPNLAFYVPLTVTLCIGLSTLAIFMRMYTKLFLIRSRALEDCKYLNSYLA